MASRRSGGPQVRPWSGLRLRQASPESVLPSVLPANLVRAKYSVLPSGLSMGWSSLPGEFTGPASSCGAPKGEGPSSTFRRSRNSRHCCVARPLLFWATTGVPLNLSEAASAATRASLLFSS